MAPGTRVFADTSEERKLALGVAAKLYQAQFDESKPDALAELSGKFIATATAIHRFLVGPAALFLHRGEIRKQGTNEPTGRTPGGASMTQIRDNEEYDLTITVASAKGNEIADQPGTQDDIQWSIEGVEGPSNDVIEIEVSADTRKCTVRALDTGSAVVRFAVGDLFGTEAVDVVAGEAALLTVTAGTPRKQEPDVDPEPPVEG